MKSGWRIMKLGELFDITSSKRVFESEWKKEGVPFYRAREIVRLAKLGFVDNELFISEDMFNRYSTKYGSPREGDIMVTGVGTLGVCYVVKKADRFYFKDGNIIWLRRMSDVDSRFVEYAFKSDFLRGQIEDSVGATVGTYTIIKAKNTLIPIPPLAEQKRIVAILDQAFEAIDIAKANTEKNLRNAHEVFDTELNDLFRRRKDDWITKQLGEIGTTRTGSTPKTSEPRNFGTAVPFIKPGDFRADGSLDYDNEGLSELGAEQARKVPAQSVLMVCIGATIGKCGYCDREIATNQQINSLTPTKDADCQFIYFQMCSSEFQKKVLLNAGQTTLPIISKSKWNALPVVLPPIKVQREIARRSGDLHAHCASLATVYDRKLSASGSLGRALLDRAFTGNL